MDIQNKKIIFVHPAIRPYRREFFEHLSANLDIEFIFVEDYEDNIKQMDEGIKIKKWKAYKSSGLLKLYKKGFAWQLIRDALFGKYDIWVSSGLFHISTHIAILFILLRGKKFYIFSEDWLFAKTLKHKIFRLLARCIVKISTGVICASKHSQNFFLALGTRKEKVFLAQNATANYEIADAKDPVVQEIAVQYFSEKIPSILYLGRVVEYKGLDVLIKAFAQIRKQILVQLIVVGGGDFLGSCKDLAKGLGTQNFVFINTSNIREVKAFYHLSDVFVLPARFMLSANVVSEAWGFTINEALSAGLPVVTTDAVAANELVVDGKNGFIVKAEDVSGLADKIMEVLKNTEAFRKNTKIVFETVNPVNQAKKFIEAIHI